VTIVEILKIFRLELLDPFFFQKNQLFQQDLPNMSHSYGTMTAFQMECTNFPFQDESEAILITG
jgi:hypothetical protein